MPPIAAEDICSACLAGDHAACRKASTAAGTVTCQCNHIDEAPLLRAALQLYTDEAVSHLRDDVGHARSEAAAHLEVEIAALRSELEEVEGHKGKQRLIVRITFIGVALVLTFALQAYPVPDYIVLVLGFTPDACRSCVEWMKKL